MTLCYWFLLGAEVDPYWHGCPESELKPNSQRHLERRVDCCALFMRSASTFESLPVGSDPGAFLHIWSLFAVLLKNRRNVEGCCVTRCLSGQMLFLRCC